MRLANNLPLSRVLLLICAGCALALLVVKSVLTTNPVPSGVVLSADQADQVKDLETAQQMIAALLHKVAKLEEEKAEMCKVQRPPGGLRYHELPPLDAAATRKKPTSSFTDATVVREAPWFDSKKTCKDTCCYQRVAITLAQDAEHMMSNIATMDLSEVQAHPVGHPKPCYYTSCVVHGIRTFFAPTLTPGMVPCLQNGTVIHADSGGGAAEFFKTYQPVMKSSYVLLTTGTDHSHPQGEGQQALLSDPNMLKWYAMNAAPNAEQVATGKFAPIPLGFNTMVDQESHIRPYLKMRRLLGEPNPFKDKTRWTNSSLLFDENEDETTEVVFARFAIQGNHNQHRWVPFNHTCNTRKRRPRNGDPVSCTANEPNFGMQETYAASSKYLFGVSPKGNGLDCYRTYELLSMGVIPIVKIGESPAADLFTDMPVVRVKTWEYTQMELLQILRDYVRSQEFAALDTEKGWEKLFLSYWRREVLAAAGREVVIDPQGVEYMLAWQYEDTTPAGKKMAQKALGRRQAKALSSRKLKRRPKRG